MTTDEKTPTADPAGDAKTGMAGAREDNSADKPAVPSKGADGAASPQLAKARAKLTAAGAGLRSSLGPWAARTTALVRHHTRRAAIRFRRSSARRFGPLAGNALRWLGRRLHPGSLVRDYRRVLLFMHRTFAGRSQESLFFVPTLGHVRLVRLSIPSQVRQTGHDYRPTPFKVFDWAMSVLPEDLSHAAFVDYGAGRGRVLLLASHYPFETVTGAEIARELFDDCLMNIAQYPRSLMKCRDVECVHTRATTLPIPEQPTVFFFFNPFDAEIFEKVLARIVRSYKRNRREMYLICVDMDEQEGVAAPGIFQPVPFSLKRRLAIKVFSPYSIRVYKTEP